MLLRQNVNLPMAGNSHSVASGYVESLREALFAFGVVLAIMWTWAGLASLENAIAESQQTQTEATDGVK